MQTLRAYLRTLPTLGQAEYARRAGTTIGYLRKAMSVGQRFDGALARRLEEESGGQVSRHELRADVFGPPPWKVVPVNGTEAGAKVDPEDFDRVMTRNWYAVRRANGPTSVTYAESAAKPQVMLHRFILGEACAGMVVDHINGDGLDNRRANLRICTQRENSRNRKAVKGYRGVSWRPDIGKWRARIMVDRREISLGAFDTENEAVDAYNKAAVEHHGEFAKLNVFGPTPIGEAPHVE